MKNVILIDFNCKGYWGFKDSLEKTSGKKWEILSMESNTDHGGYKNFIRYFKYFYFPFSIFLHRKDYGTVLARQQFYGLILAFYLRLFRVKSGPDISLMTFIYKKKMSVLGRIYYHFFRYSLKCKFIKNVFVYSAYEQDYYANLFKMSKEIFKFVKLGVEDDFNKIGLPKSDEGYYLSAGSSNRDYDYLTNAWNFKDKNLKIICDTLNVPSSNNIEILDNCYGDSYKRMIANSHAVIIPLQNEEISSGQLVALHAMMFGKPVITTSNNAIMSYVADGENGFIIEKTEAALEYALLKLDNPETYRQMCTNARDCFTKNYTQEILGTNVGKILLQQFCEREDIRYVTEQT